MLIRSYKPDDQESVIALWNASGLSAAHNNPYEDIKRKTSVDPDGFLVGVLQNRVIATCMVGYEGHRGWINYLGVLPSEQRKGYARQLMLEAERILLKRGCPKINLQVRAGNSSVLEFYERIGYRTDAVISMGKRLIQDCPTE